MANSDSMEQARARVNRMSEGRRRNVAEDTERQMRGLRPKFGGPQSADTDPDASDSGIYGTAEAGYARPEDGPFRCDACAHGSFPGQGDDDASGTCDQPKVVADPEVKGQVAGGGCCTYFEPKTQAQPGPDDETETDRSASGLTA